MRLALDSERIFYADRRVEVGGVRRDECGPDGVPDTGVLDGIHDVAGEVGRIALAGLSGSVADGGSTVAQRRIVRALTLIA